MAFLAQVRLNFLLKSSIAGTNLGTGFFQSYLSKYDQMTAIWFGYLRFRQVKYLWLNSTAPVNVVHSANSRPLHMLVKTEFLILVTGTLLGL